MRYLLALGGSDARGDRADGSFWMGLVFAIGWGGFFGGSWGDDDGGGWWWWALSDGAGAAARDKAGEDGSLLVISVFWGTWRKR